MTATEIKLENRLNALPDVYPGFVQASLHSIKQCGLVSEILDLLDETPDATTESVLIYESLRCGLIDRLDDNGARMPIPCAWLALTAGMRDILADMRGKTLKSYQLAIATGDGMLADRSVRLNLGQHAIDLNCCDFTFEMCGRRTELAAMLCEKMSLRDDFGPDPDIPIHAHAVGERVTGVELVTDHAEVLRGNDADVLDVDVAVAVRTAHAVYTFARESWRSTNIRVATSDGIAVPCAPGEINAGWLGLPKDSGVVVGETSRTIAKLA